MTHPLRKGTPPPTTYLIARSRLDSNRKVIFTKTQKILIKKRVRSGRKKRVRQTLRMKPPISSKP